MQLGVNKVLFGGHDLRTACRHIKQAGYELSRSAMIAAESRGYLRAVLQTISRRRT